MTENAEKDVVGIVKFDLIGLLHINHIISGALVREARSRAPLVRKCGNLSIREILVIL